MLCISVAPVSRKLAKADLLNAAGQCDLIELCVDYFVKEPDIGDILQGIPKPVAIACRRPQDGGKFEGTDEERMTLLRQAIVAGPEYIELDLETAAKVPRFGKTKRLISVTSLSGPPADLDAVFEEAAAVKADAIKFAWPTPTFEAAWPLLKLLSQKRSLPVVGLGLGRAALTLALLGKMLEAPWSYAALEKGLESFPGQPTVSELKDNYAWDDIGPKTRFVGLVGPIERQTGITARVLNAAFRKLDDRHRCLPLTVHSFDKLLTRLEGLKIHALLVAPSLAVGGGAGGRTTRRFRRAQRLRRPLGAAAGRLDGVQYDLEAGAGGPRGATGQKVARRAAARATQRAGCRFGGDGAGPRVRNSKTQRHRQRDGAGRKGLPATRAEI